MNILHLSNTPLSNSPSNLAKIQCDAGHNSKVLLHRQSNTNKIFVGGDIWTHMNSEEISDIVQRADVIHLHNFAWEQEIFKKYPHLVVMAKKKRCLIQYHSPRNSIENFEVTVNDPFFRGRRAVVAQYQVRIYPEAEHVVPNVLPIYDPLYTPIGHREWEQPALSFAPSNINLRGWDDKGHAQVKDIFHKLLRMGGVGCDIIINTPYEDTLVKKKWSTIGLEEVVTGSYHLSFLEYMSLGCATICNMDGETRAAMARVVGQDAVNELPAFQTTPETLFPTIVSLITNPQKTKQAAVMSRDWMKRHWNPSTFVRYFENIYSTL